MNKLLIFIILSFIYININGQALSFFNTERRISTLFSIEKEGFKSQRAYYFNDSNSPNSAFLVSGKKVNKSRSRIISDGELIWIKNFNKKISLNIDSLQLQMSYFVEGINSFNLNFIYDDGSYHKYKIPILKNGYQNPIVIRFDSLHIHHINDSFEKKIKKKGLISIELSVFPKALRNKVIISEFRLLQVSETQKEVNNYFLNRFSKKETQNLSNKNSLNFQNPIAIIGDYFIYGDAQSREYFVKYDSDKYSKKDVVIRFFEEVFKCYPYYEYTDLDSKHVLSKLEIFRDTLINYNDFLDSLNVLVNQFKDPHFLIVNKPSQKKDLFKKWINPLPFYYFDNKTFATAVFDTTISEIKYGDQIIYCMRKRNGSELNIISKSFPGKLIENISDTSKYFIKAINSYKDTIEFSYISNQKNIVIPDNFKPINGSLSQQNQIFYFKINHFEEATFDLFINNFNNKDKSKGLIFDLRNCPGGNTETANKFISLFITHPIITQHTSVVGIPNYKESFVLKPNRNYYINKPICILVNNNTACAAEYFIHHMKNSSNSVVIGNCKTSGTYSTIYDVVFPDGFRCRINCFTKEELYPKRIIENTGIEPDIWVQLPEVKDLYPYEDKVLRTAYRFLEAY